MKSGYQDTGIGIERKYFKEVFDIFFSKKNEEGQGGTRFRIGIIHSKKHLVESQGGKIDVESIYGKGSNFKFTLPIYNEK